MPPVYTYDHIHLRTKNPQATIEYYQKMFDATPVEYVQSNGKSRVDLRSQRADHLHRRSASRRHAAHGAFGTLYRA